MDVTRAALFDTPIGSCAIVWRGPVICAVQLPERSPDATIARIIHRFPDAVWSEPEGEAVRAVARMTALLSGAAVDLSDLVLEEARLTDFDRAVYQAARRIGPGQTSTYGAIAAAIGKPNDARAVGQALGRNPFPIIVPCHRVLGSGGRVGGFSGGEGVATKLAMLRIERAQIGDGPSLFEADALPLAIGPERSQ